MMFLIRFWRSLTKKGSVESAKYEITTIYICTSVFGRFFHGSGSGFPNRIWIFGLSGLSKKSLIRIRKKPGSETLLIFTSVDPKKDPNWIQFRNIRYYYWFKSSSCRRRHIWPLHQPASYGPDGSNRERGTVSYTVRYDHWPAIFISNSHVKNF